MGEDEESVAKQRLQSGDLKLIENLALFARIVQSGGISRCANLIGIERSTISRRMASLEQWLGVKLLKRMPNCIAVTTAGSRCYNECERLLVAATQARDLATRGRLIPNEQPLVVGAPAEMIDRFLESRLADFEAKNPGVIVERRAVASWTRAAVEQVDVALTLSPLLLQNVWARSLTPVTQIVCASAAYIEQFGRPVRPYDLEQHACIAEASNGTAAYWKFALGRNPTLMVPVNVRHIVSSVLEAREAALAGLGICRLPDYMLDGYLGSRRLVELFPDYRLEDRRLMLISPRRSMPKPNATGLRIFLEEALGGNKPKLSSG